MTSSMSTCCMFTGSAMTLTSQKIQISVPSAVSIACCRLVINSSSASQDMLAVPPDIHLQHHWIQVLHILQVFVHSYCTSIHGTASWLNTLHGHHLTC